MNPRRSRTDPARAAHREFYDAFALGYDTHMGERTRHLVQLLPGFIDLGGKRVLDIGIGTADVWAQVHRAGIAPVHVTGVDISRGMLEQANVRNLPFLKTVQGTIGMLPATHRFDVVTMMEIIRHSRDPGRLAARARRLLRPGGTLLVEDLSVNDSNVRVDMAAARVLADLLPRGARSSFHLPDEDLRIAIESADLSLARWEPFGFQVSFGSFVEAWGYFLNETMLGWRIDRLPENRRRIARERMRKVLMETLGSPVLHRKFFLATFEMR
jgi:2-polyprenyl-3-methyl-5-hydroxy-6-metoxy-1,4-benzoquinol methylase